MFLRSLVSKKLAVTAAAVTLIQSLPMSADAKGLCTALVALAYVLGQAYVDAQPEDPAPPATHLVRFGPEPPIDPVTKDAA
jgi:hypothetical protein